jgi:hypothetical protein
VPTSSKARRRHHPSTLSSGHDAFPDRFSSTLLASWSCVFLQRWPHGTRALRSPPRTEIARLTVVNGLAEDIPKCIDGCPAPPVSPLMNKPGETERGVRQRNTVEKRNLRGRRSDPATSRPSAHHPFRASIVRSFGPTPFPCLAGRGTCPSSSAPPPPTPPQVCVRRLRWQPRS